MGLAVIPLGLAAVFAAFKKPALASTFAGLGVAAGVVGAVGTEWFLGPGTKSPLLKRGWVNGTPTAVSIQDEILLADVDQKLIAAGGYAYSGEALIDRSQHINGVAGFWSRP